MATLIAIDPGKERSHVAFFRNGKLVKAGRLDAIDCGGQEMPSPGDLVVIEVPRIYPRGHKRPNDLIDVAFMAGNVAGIFSASGYKIKTVYPAEWKRQLKKPVCHMRLLEVLMPAEIKLLPPGTVEKVTAAAERFGKTGKVTKYSWEGHNTLDAIAIGATELGRLVA